MKILELYKELAANKDRFIEEVFDGAEYQSAYPKLTILDIGAYGGEFSFACLNFASKIYAIEPEPTAWETLKRRFEEYELQDKMEIFNIAIAGKSGERYFDLSGYGASRLLVDGDEYIPEKQTKVNALSLADFMKTNKIDKVDILKIDVEDGEKEIFAAPEFPKLSKKIKVIIGEHLGSVDGLLCSVGYSQRLVEGSNFIYERT